MKLPLTALVFASLAACTSAPASTPPAASRTRGADGNALRIKLTTVYVDDQDKALRFYTEVLGFTKKADVGNGGYRWLTVVSPDDPDGAELQLARHDNPAAKAFQEANFQAGQPAAMFFSDDIAGTFSRLQAAGAEITLPPTDVTGSTIAMLKDGCGNLIQVTQLRR